ncbi:hypothetical protein [Salinicoccus halitifaciens]|uniref:Ribosomal protein S3AE n=1 Tax=Salinicoccus halitifaciens TaxID=1073415 RepID=A0ABV2E8F0_9STAP|nr:hypothetical protein [Salinicoccus halitifaciens]MCD2137826.1 hypothetical protein [Salinicoccus halitifaciens]
MNYKEIEMNKFNETKLSDVKYFREKYIERENEVNDLLINKEQLHHLLIHVELQMEEVESIYQMLNKYSGKSNTNDYMNSNFAQLRSLIEIAQEHNMKHLEEQKEQ